MTAQARVAGILLAAGRGARFDPDGAANKLMAAVPGRDAVVVACAAGALLGALTDVLAVVRPGAAEVASQLRALGCRVSTCPDADQGMGASLVHALEQTRDAAAWVIALGDMPHVQTATVRALLAALANGADIAAPLCQGRRGNPVAFGRTHLGRLLKLGGDAGARSLLREWPVTEVEVDDPGIHRDVDFPEDLRTWTA
ncbi:MAG: nucleotidyltransferase family protein [Pseudomonadota bacterium]